MRYDDDAPLDTSEGAGQRGRRGGSGGSGGDPDSFTTRCDTFRTNDLG